MSETRVLEYQDDTAVPPAGLSLLVRLWPGVVGMAVILLCRREFILHRELGHLSTHCLIRHTIEMITAVPLIISAVVPRPRLMFGAVCLVAAVQLVYLRGILGDWITWANFCRITWGNFCYAARPFYCLVVAGWVLSGYCGERRGRNHSVALILCGIGILAVGADTLQFHTYDLAKHWVRGSSLLSPLRNKPEVAYGGAAAALLVAGGVGTLFRIPVAARVSWIVMLVLVGTSELLGLYPELSKGFVYRIRYESAGIQFWELFRPDDLDSLGQRLGEVVIAWGAMAAMRSSGVERRDGSVTGRSPCVDGP